MSRVGVFGGTFDPPHLGHLILAEQGREQLNLNQVLWVPAGEQPLKMNAKITNADLRVQMLRLALQGNSHFTVSYVDLDRPGPHYTIDTLSILKREHPASELVFLMGGDSLAELPRWRAPEQIVRIAMLAVMNRPDTSFNISELEQIVPNLHQNLQFIDGPLVDISATELRQQVVKGQSIRYLVPRPVFEFIKRHDLYQ